MIIIDPESICVAVMRCSEALKKSYNHRLRIFNTDTVKEAVFGLDIISDILENSRVIADIREVEDNGSFNERS